MNRKGITPITSILILVLIIIIFVCIGVMWFEYLYSSEPQPQEQPTNYTECMANCIDFDYEGDDFTCEEFCQDHENYTFENTTGNITWNSELSTHTFNTSFLPGNLTLTGNITYKWLVVLDDNDMVFEIIRNETNETAWFNGDMLCKNIYSDWVDYDAYCMNWTYWSEIFEEVSE